MLDALDQLWGYTAELFEVDDLEQDLIDAGIAVDSRALQATWLNTVSETLTAATLEVPETTWTANGGRSGIHTESGGIYRGRAAVYAARLSRTALVMQSIPATGVSVIPTLPQEEYERRQRRSQSTCADIWAILDAVMDPEIPVISIYELGVLQDVSYDGERVTVLLTPILHRLSCLKCNGRGCA